MEDIKTVSYSFGELIEENALLKDENRELKLILKKEYIADNLYEQNIELKRELANLHKFLDKYHGMWDEQRRKVCCELNEQIYSWNVVYLEVLNDTNLSKEMLKAIKWR